MSDDPESSNARRAELAAMTAEAAEHDAYQTISSFVDTRGPADTEEHDV